MTEVVSCKEDRTGWGWVGWGGSGWAGTGGGIGCQGTFRLERKNGQKKREKENYVYIMQYRVRRSLVVIVEIIANDKELCMGMKNRRKSC